MPKRAPIRATIDRVVRDQTGAERAVLVFDDGQQLVLPLELLPPGARAQQVISIAFEIDADESADRADQVSRLQRELFGQ